ncbi:Gfo/Idh/MocA family protein [Microbacterium sp. DT81.1]|uniref:Gfo/Idh/MocA family protein n=1 Tax=Microbacterium sp. DT81.1 TaxID=3393413 RepID=UPI003CE91558
MTDNPTRIAFLGAGNIAGPYAESVARHPELSLVGVFDVDAEKAAQLAASTGSVAYATLDELAADAPEIVVNLSSAPYHYATSLELIGRGLNVFSEKPLALEPGQAAELVTAAQSAGVRLACAPSIWLGRAQLAAAERVLSGAIGEVGLVKAEVNQGRIETWHPAPGSFYQVGPVVDAGVYPITYLTAVLGPIREVSALSSMSVPDRVTLGGEAFRPHANDTWVVIATFESGTALTLTCNFFVDSATQPRTITFHGASGSIALDDWFLPGAGVREAAYGSPLTVALPADAGIEADWALGVADLATAIRENRPHRNGSEHAAHVVDVLDAIRRSEAEGTRVGVTSSFPSPFSALAHLNA